MSFPSTYADIQNAVIVKARLDPALDLAKVKDWINQYYFKAAVEVEAIIQTATMTCTAGAPSYTLPSQTARIKQMAIRPYGSANLNPPLILTTLDEILERRQGGADSAASGAWATHYTLLGINDFELWPTPAVADVIELHYVAYPAALANQTELPVFEEPYSSKILEFGGLAEAGDFKGDPSTNDWLNSYNQWVSDYGDHLAAKRGVIPGQFHQWGDGWAPSGYWGAVGVG